MGYVYKFSICHNHAAYLYLSILRHRSSESEEESSSDDEGSLYLLLKCRRVIARARLRTRKGLTAN